MSRESIITKAIQIAKESLRACYTKEGIFAGLTHFNEYWTRDGLWSVLGVLKISDSAMAEKQIQLFLNHTNDCGEVPLRLTSKHGNLWRIFNLPNIGKIKPFFGLNPAYFIATDKKGLLHRAKDGGSLLAIAISEYLEHTKDSKKVKTWWPKLVKAMSWYDQYRQHDLIIEDWHEGWMDSLRLKGASLYTNVLYIRALESMRKIAKALNQNQEKWQRQYQLSKHSLMKHFYNGNYLNVLATKNPNEPQSFVVDGNMLAVWWKIIPKNAAKKIILHFLKSGVSRPIPCRTNTPGFPDAFIPKRFKLIGMNGYHNDHCSWLWVGAVSALAVNRYFSAKAKKILRKISQLIIKHGQVYEIYDQNGNPYNTWSYKSEHPFAWSSALFLLAATELSTT